MKSSTTALSEHVRRAMTNPARLHALERVRAQITARDDDFDRLSRTAVHSMAADSAMLSLVGEEQQWTLSSAGMEHAASNATDVSFSAYTIALSENEKSFVVLDAAADERFHNSSLVTGGARIRFYAGVPVVVAGERVGSLCVIGLEPRVQVPPALIEHLIDLAALAASLFTLKDEARSRAHTAAALFQEEWRHALTLEVGKVGSWLWNLSSGEVACNDMFRGMCGLAEAGPVRARDILEAIHAADRDRVRQDIGASLESGLDYKAEIRVATTGGWMSVRGRIYQRDGEGKPLIMMGVSIDISESKQSAEHTRLLLRELNHRVKNTLAMIQSVARQTIRQNPDPTSFINSFSGRLRTISDAHVLLADRDWSFVQLYEVIGAQFGTRFLTSPDRAEVSGDDVALPADHALGLGLILHELTTNAHRHGAWSNSKGIVSIKWEVEETPVRGLRLHWKERGGPPVKRPGEYGLGGRLIERSLAKVLDSGVQLRFGLEGVEADIWIPLPPA